MNRQVRFLGFTHIMLFLVVLGFNACSGGFSPGQIGHGEQSSTLGDIDENPPKEPAPDDDNPPDTGGSDEPVFKPVHLQNVSIDGSNFYLSWNELSDKPKEYVILINGNVASQFTTDQSNILVRGLAKGNYCFKVQSRLEEVGGTELLSNEICSDSRLASAADGTGGAIQLALNQGVANRYLPPEPSRLFDIHLTEGNGQYARPYIPPMRTSLDGRVAFNLKGDMRFFLFTPEKLDRPLADSGPHIKILSELRPREYPESRFHRSPKASLPDFGRKGHKSLCDPGGRHDASASGANPYACGPGNSRDCYDLSVITPYGYTENGPKLELWATPIKVQVINPKTAEAKIENVTIGTPTKSPTFSGLSAFFEGNPTGDGLMYVARVGSSVLRWRNQRTGQMHQGRQDMVYIVSENSTPCDVTAWRQVMPMSHAPHDPRINRKYGFAMNPFRDTKGRPIPDGVYMTGTYPWIDRQGRNLFFTIHAGEELAFTDPHSRTIKYQYETRCLNNSTCAPPRQNNPEEQTVGFGFMGAWSQGKTIIFDGILNNTRYNMFMEESDHRLVKLYTGSREWIRVGSGRQNGFNGYNPPTSNSAFIDSLENLFNYTAALAPMTPRDVVWRMNSGKASEEVVFDEYINVNTLISSSMMPGTTADWSRSSRIRYDLQTGFQAPGGRPAGYYSERRIQNEAAAIPERWAIPQDALIEGPGRIEPVALGGIYGRGLFMQGSTRLTYQVPRQPTDTNSHSWFVGLFIDPRFSADHRVRKLLKYPDGTEVFLHGYSRIEVKKGQHQFQIELPNALRLQANNWSHIGFVARNAGKVVDVAINGYRFFRWDSPNGASFFNLEQGTLVVGDYPENSLFSGITAWVDDVKVIAEDPNLEVLCNYARGTMVKLNSAAPRAVRDLAQAYPLESHQDLAKAINGDQNPNYVCLTDYDSEHGISHRKLPAYADSLRDQLLFPEGPLVFNRPRPDSSRNGFCLSCHPESGIPGLDLKALLPVGLASQFDTRRQPLQPEAKIFGHVPAGHFGDRKPSNHVISDDEGRFIDEWVLGR